MARLSRRIEELAGNTVPLEVYAAGRMAGSGPEKLVKTHCCFCGQQCGIQLKVRQRWCFEPWEEFPFNRACTVSKGVKRYMQSSHPTVCCRR
jgi:assimilatory nitrate reductase catalytic subunit